MISRLLSRARFLCVSFALVLLPHGGIPAGARADTAPVRPPAPTAEEEEEEDWLNPLRLQIRGSHGCDVAHLVSVRKLPLAGEVTIEGRLRCLDGREYEFTRPKKHLKFDIRLCQPTIC